MKNLIYIFLATVLIGHAVASLVSLENAKTHFRINLRGARGEVLVKKEEDRIILRSLNSEVIDQAFRVLKKSKLDKRFIKKIEMKVDRQRNVSFLDITLAEPQVEYFSFFRDREQRYVVDLWKENLSAEEEVLPAEQKEAKPVPMPEKPKVLKAEVLQKKEQEAKKKLKKVSKRKDKVKVRQAKPIDSKKLAKKNPEYRDFRYGAPFLWDYDVVAPDLKSVMRLDRKTAEFFHPIENRDVEKSDQEAHLQLTINLYRQEKWGLMYKSIKLFDKKYPGVKPVIHEYMKANAILKENLNKGETEPVKMAIKMYENIIPAASQYTMRRAIRRYLGTYYVGKLDYISSLKIAKAQYVDSKENHDYEESETAVQLILHSLSKLNQIDQLAKLSHDATLIKLIPAQELLAYQIYSKMILGKIDDVIKEFETKKSGLAKPIHHSLLYNVAEAYFRKGEYEKSMALFDEFLGKYSYRTEASQARVRIALAYELLEKPAAQTVELYRNALNRATNFNAAFEARIRYVAFRNLRKIKPDEKDKEVRIFLDRGQQKESRYQKEFKELLWLVRLRTLIVDGEYEKALSYLKAIPIKSMTPTRERVFEGDGAEIVMGMITKQMNEGNYAKVIKTWEIFKEKYDEKVAIEPQALFSVGKSYLNLGIKKDFDDLYKTLEESTKYPTRTFPIWVERNDMNSNSLLSELAIIRALKDNNLVDASRYFQQLKDSAKSYKKNDYYAGLIAFRNGNYEDATRSFERYLTNVPTKKYYDAEELSFLIRDYSEALYQLGDQKRFQRVARALVQDLEPAEKKNPFMKSAVERVSYLLIESLASTESVEAYTALEPLAIKFSMEYPEGKLLGRVRYLLGLSYVKRDMNGKGKAVFEEILKNNSHGPSVKEMARSELSLLKIKQKT